MLATAHSHAPTLVWGIILIAVGVVHLVFRRYYARRAAAVQRARRDTAARPFKPFTFATSESTNLVMNSLVSAAFVVIGVIVLIASLS
jgi:hypothetical protein